MASAPNKTPPIFSVAFVYSFFVQLNLSKTIDNYFHLWYTKLSENFRRNIMIFDNVNNCKKYSILNDKFAKSFEFIKKVCEESLPAGKYQIIEGGELYASVQEYDSKAPENAKAEGHDKYIDIQYVVSGEEVMEVFDISKAVVKTPYNPDKDVTFYENCENASKLVLQAGEYAILYPNDIHRPGMQYKSSTPVKKVVVKVKI